MTTKKMTFPTCASEFLSAISSDLKKWQMAIIDAEAYDTKNDSRAVFWLSSDSAMTAYVAHEYGRMIVNIGTSYHIDLVRLNDDTDYRWSKHLSHKEWVTSSQHELVKELEKLFKDHVKK